MKNFNDFQRDWENQTLSKYEHEMDMYEQADAAHEAEILKHLANLYVMTGAELADRSTEISIAMENYAEDLAQKGRSETETFQEPYDPEDDFGRFD